MKLLLTFLLIFSNTAYSQGLIQSLTGEDLNASRFATEKGIYYSSWLSAGVSYASNNNDNHDNFPLTFNDRHTEFQLNQAYFSLQSPVNVEADHWNIGGQFDFMFGTDSRFTQSFQFDDRMIGEDDFRFYDVALPQAYLEVYAPWGNGLTMKVGHFYTLIGYEVVTAPDNFFFSHAYTMQYAEPFTHTGVLFQYPINNNFNLSLGAVAGWDSSDLGSEDWSFLGNLSWVDDEAVTSVALSVISGDVASTGSNRSMYSLVITHQLTDQFSYVFQHDFGYEEQERFRTEDAYWFGINQYLFYEYNEQLSLGLRAEWFRDADDTRLALGASSSFYEISAGLNWSPMEWLTFRPELRYDWVDSAVDAYDNGNEDDLLSFSIDFIIAL